MSSLPSYCRSDIKPVFMILLNQSRNLWMTPLIAAEKLAIRALCLYLALYLLCISVSAFTLVLSYISSDWHIQSRLWTFFSVKLLYGQILFQSKHLIRVDSHRWEFPFSVNSSEMRAFLLSQQVKQMLFPPFLTSCKLSNTLPCMFKSCIFSSKAHLSYATILTENLKSTSKLPYSEY